MKKNLKQSEDALERNFSPPRLPASSSTISPVLTRSSSSYSSLSRSSQSLLSPRQNGSSSPYYIHQLPGRRISKMVLYETPTHYYLVGHDKQRGGFEVLRVERNRPEDLQITCIAREFSLREVMQYLNALDPTRGGAKKCGIAYGILGFVRFVQYWYMVLISKKKKVGAIGPHYIYAVSDICYLTLSPASVKLVPSTDETRYTALFFGFDLSSTYFSYTYDLTHSLQHNMSGHLYPARNTEVNDKYVWNRFILDPLMRSAHSASWILPIIHGYYSQSVYSILGKSMSLTLIARRSRHFAGVRYMKRGINNEGFCANDVETEQIVQDVSQGALHVDSKFSSYVQLRGSIPLYWAQESQALLPKPLITAVRADPFYDSAILHFRELMSSYGSPIIILNLIKTKEKVPRETTLKEEFENCIQFVNERLVPGVQIVYIPWDFHLAQKSKREDPITQLVAIAETSLVKTGFFCTAQRPYRAEQFKHMLNYMSNQECPFGSEQRGVIRTNCIDSLDRTNAAQFCIGKVVLGHQMFMLGLSESPAVPFDDDVMALLMAKFEDMGNQIALQYGGSQLAHTMKAYQGKSKNLSRDLLTTARRFYNNSFTDFEKQMAINLFLGKYIPWLEREKLWELETDYHRHMSPARGQTPLSASAWWTEPLQQFLPAPLAVRFSRPPTDRLFDVYYRSGRMSHFDKMLLQPHNNTVWASVSDDSAVKPKKGVFYLPGVRRWFPDTENPLEGPSAQFSRAAPPRHKAQLAESSSKEDSERRAMERRAYQFFGIRPQSQMSPDTDMYRRWLDLDQLLPRRKRNNLTSSTSGVSLSASTSAISGAMSPPPPPSALHRSTSSLRSPPPSAVSSSSRIPSTASFSQQITPNPSASSNSSSSGVLSPRRQQQQQHYQRESDLKSSASAVSNIWPLRHDKPSVYENYIKCAHQQQVQQRDLALYQQTVLVANPALPLY